LVAAAARHRRRSRNFVKEEREECVVDFAVSCGPPGASGWPAPAGDGSVRWCGGWRAGGLRERRRPRLDCGV